MLDVGRVSRKNGAKSGSSQAQKWFGISDNLIDGLRFAIHAPRAGFQRMLAPYIRQTSGITGGRQPTALERKLAAYVLDNPGPPVRFALRQMLGQVSRQFRREGLIRILGIGLHARDPKLVSACLIRLAKEGKSNRGMLRQLTNGGVSFDAELISWLKRTLNKTFAEIKGKDPDAAAEYVGNLANFLSDLLSDLQPVHVLELARSLEPVAPDNSSLLVLLGNCEKLIGNFEKADILLRRALKDPQCDPAAHFDLAEVLEFLGDDKGAIEVAREGRSHFTEEELFLSNPGCLTLSAGPLMRTGDLVAGWQQYQKRRDRFVFEPPPKVAVWEGEALRDESLLLLAEKGIGDEIRYASCYADLLTKVYNLSVSADPRLIPLLERSFPDVRFIPAVRSSSGSWRRKSVARETFKLSRALSLDLYCLAMQFDHLCMAGDVPLYLRREPAAFPRHSGYLIPDGAKQAEWRRRLEALGPGLKVGFTWRSASQTYKRDQHYFALEQLLPVLQVKGAHFVNLQYDSCEDELAEFERNQGIAVHRWEAADLKDDLDGVAALISELDLVIAPHTMVKELAGAVGTPTLFMVPTGQAWVRWRGDPETGEDIWHPSVVHMQSARAGDKQEVIQKVAARLEEIVAAKGPEADWRPHTRGFHPAEDQQTTIDETSGECKERVKLRNESGETYSPAPYWLFEDIADRNREWKKRAGEFDESCRTLMSGAQQPAKPKGVLLVNGHNSLKQHSLTVFGARALLDRGWGVVSLEKSSIYPMPVAKNPLAHFNGILGPGYGRRSYRHRDKTGRDLHFEWKIDWEARSCVAEGINFFPILANRLGKEFRRYEVDTTNPKVASRLRTLIGTCDAALRVCIDIEEKLVPLGVPVRITGFEPNYPATGVFKVYCGERGWRHGIEFVEIRQAYEKYFRAGQSGFVNAIEVQNVTRRHLYSAAGLRGEQFEAWLKAGGSEEAVGKRGEAWATQNRSGHCEPTPEGKVLLERIQRHRARGGKVACLYGCIPFDFGHPWPDKGLAHEDLIDWYNHTVETLNGSDVMLLVKPHPSEADFEQFGRPEEFFVEMLKVQTERNISLLGHRWLNNSDLYPYLDFGIIWRGSIATELSLLGVPVVVCAPYSMTDHVLDFPMPKDRADYEDMLRNPDRITLTEELKQRAARVFDFYRTECMIEYPFGWISSKRKEAGPPVLSEGAIKVFLAEGHPAVNEICRRIIADEDGYA